MTVQQLAEASHQVNRLFRREMNDFSLLEWEHLSEEDREKIIEEVTTQMYHRARPETEDFFTLVVHELKKFVK